MLSLLPTLCSQLHGKPEISSKTTQLKTRQLTPTLAQ